MQKRTTLKVIASAAGVSYQTVSKVLNRKAQVSAETEARIWEAVRELGYKPHHNARNLRFQRTCMIGYSWVPSGPGETNSILDEFLTSMVEAAEAAGYHMLPFPFREGDDNLAGYQELIQTGRVDGFVLSSVGYGDPRPRYLTEANFPFVAFGRADQASDFPWVDVDGRAGLRLAMRHLLQSGHRRIAVLAWPPGSRVGDERLEGYLSAANEAGAQTDPDWIARISGDFESGRAATDGWLDAHNGRRPTAVVAFNDAMAAGALHSAQARGLVVGRDLAIVGFDDSPVARCLRPALSSVRQPIREAGRLAIEILAARLESRAPLRQHVLLQPELIVRESSSSLPG